MDHPSLRWGFLSTAGIGRKNWESIRLSGNGIVAGVASRELASAQRFISECQSTAPFDVPPRAFASYEELVAAPDIDALYIPLPTGLRQEWVIRAARAGKHVLCEKPCAVSAAALREMLAACRDNGVLFMDGVMFMHSARLPAIRALLDDGASTGRLRRVVSSFGFNGGENFRAGNIRMNSALEPHGCLGDLGWYCIRLALWAARGSLPVSVAGRILGQAGRADSPGPVPTALAGDLIFEDGLSSSFYCSFDSGNYRWARLDGEKGAISMDDFVVPSEETAEVGFFLDGRRINIDEQATRHPTAQATKLFRTFAGLALTGGAAGGGEWAEIALKTQQIQDALYESALAGGVAVKPL